MNPEFLYWPTYESLEHEVLEMASYILFTDKQVKVYSPGIADLIVRCAIEIESIRKLLYCRLDDDMHPKKPDGKDCTLYFDTDCIQLLVDHWSIDRKKVLVVAPVFDFTSDAYTVLCPLHKANKQGSSRSRWKRAYQSIKHDKMNGLTQATVENLINTLAALFLLNVYLKNERYEYVERFGSNTGFDSRLGSRVFSLMTLDATKYTLSTKASFNDRCIIMPKGTSFEEYSYILRHDDVSIRGIWSDFCRDDFEIAQRMCTNPTITSFLEANPDFARDNSADLSPIDLCLRAGGTELARELVQPIHLLRHRVVRTEAIVNRHDDIYPTLAVGT